MRLIKQVAIAAITVVMFGGVVAFGQSVISYTLELGGENHATGYESNQLIPFTRGLDEDDQVFIVGDIITWDVVVEVSGIHQDLSDPENPVNLWAPYGAANLVFDLELHRAHADGPLVTEMDAGSPTETGWFSTINDGDDDGARGSQYGPDRLENTAFCFSLDTLNDYPEPDVAYGPGRLFEPFNLGGPLMENVQYPSAQGRSGGPKGTGYPNNIPGGILAGIGCGYNNFLNVSGCPYTCQEVEVGRTAGIGLELVMDGYPGFGIQSLFEGQMNTTGLKPGVYVLKLVPEEVGNNIIRGDAAVYEDVESEPFAIAANQVHGDTITFTLQQSP